MSESLLPYDGERVLREQVLDEGHRGSAPGNVGLHEDQVANHFRRLAHEHGGEGLGQVVLVQNRPR